ncbi:protein EFFECTOR OF TRANSCRIPTION 2-like [Zingiber officinale]|uniref:protein EFFECTOR OF TRANSCRIPTION 2-like n=1 Tax=Zingiber officinale TaxID=94328 RepID=UPI001C4D516F|nr:protein EFFECTOR OF TRANSCRIPTION 2-like [Zingiber officinale]
MPAMIFPPKLRREECDRTKHDSIFSPWKVLIGSSDWNDYSLGKDGVTRYRTHNLPANCACPGLYELGIIAAFTNEIHKTRQHALSKVVVVYLGQADNVRTRLQQYGRAGSHLDHGCSVTSSRKIEIPELKTGPGLFKEIFSMGFSIVFRWAPVSDKKEAMEMERRLLEVFDYAWNTIWNGTCRREDILKLDKGLSNSNVGFWKRLLSSKKLGIKIAPDLPLLEDESENKRGFLPQILNLVKSWLQSVKHDDKLHQDEVICGVAIGYGSICKNKPVPGRKRCSNHKGKRITGISHVTSRDNIMAEDESSASNNKLSNPLGSEFEPEIIQETCLFGEEYDTCGMICRDGSICQNMPVQGRKRCELHKGQTITTQKLSTGRADRSVEGTHIYNLEFAICGVVSGDGLVCRSKPAPGRKRCGLHKGQRITTRLKSLTSTEHPSKFGDEVNICGVDIGNELVCKRKPVEGRKRCEEHKGMRIKPSKSST